MNNETVIAAALKMQTDSVAKLKAFLWYHLFGASNPKKWSAPTREQIEKLTTEMRVTEKEFMTAMKEMDLQFPIKTNEIEPASINNPEIKGLIQYWNEMTGLPLSIGEKLAMNELLKQAKQEEIKTAITNFSLYNKCFDNVGPTERGKAFLYRRTFQSFTKNFEKFLIGKDGTTSEFSMLKSWASTKPAGDGDAYWGAFARYASAALSQWRFAPKPEVADPKPVYTVATFVFSDRPTAELRGKCAIPSLQMHLLELRNDPRMGRKMSRGVFGELEIDPMLEQKYWASQRAIDAATKREAIPLPPRPTPPPKP